MNRAAASMRPAALSAAALLGACGGGGGPSGIAPPTDQAGSPAPTVIDDPVQRIAEIDFYRIWFKDDDRERALASARFRRLDEPVPAAAVLEHLAFGEERCTVRGPEPSPYPAGSIEDFAGENVSAGEVLTLLDSGNGVGELRMTDDGGYVTEGRYIVLSEPDAPIALQVPGDAFPGLGTVASRALQRTRGGPPGGITAGPVLPDTLPPDLPFHWFPAEQPGSLLLVGFSSGENDERSVSCRVADAPQNGSATFSIPERVRAAADDGYERVGMSRVLHDATITTDGTLLLITSEKENKYPLLVPTEVAD